MRARASRVSRLRAGDYFAAARIRATRKRRQCASLIHGSIVLLWLWALLFSTPPAQAAGFISDASAQTGTGRSAERAGRAGSHGTADGGLLNIEAQLGFTNTFRLGRWTPLSVLVSNRGSDVRGHLEVTVASGSGLQDNLVSTVYRRTVELPRDGRKRFAFTVFADSFDRPLDIRIVSGGHERASASVDLRRTFTNSRLILTLSRDADLDYLNDASGDGIRVLYPLPELLPEHWQGYDGVAAVIVHGLSLTAMSARQYEALRKWIAGGGTLAISGGPDQALLRTPRIAGLLPGATIGRARFENGDAVSDALQGAMSVPRLEAPTPFTLDRLSGYRGRALVSAGPTPLVIRQARGRGAVVYLSFDVARYPFAGWPGLRRVWLESLQLAPTPPLSLSSRQKLMPGPVQALVAGQSAGFPDRITVTVFVALYFCILATGYRLRPTAKGSSSAKPTRAPNARPGRYLVWLTPLVFAPAAYLLFGPLRYPHGGTALVVSTLEPLQGTAFARLRLNLGVYSRLGGGLRLSYEHPEPLLRPSSRDAANNAARGWTLGVGSPRSIEIEDRRSFVLRTLEGQDIVKYRMQSTAEHAADGIRLRLRNDSGAALRGAWFVHNKVVYPLGGIEDGTDSRQTLNATARRFDLEEATWVDVLGAGGIAPGLGQRATASIVRRELDAFSQREDVDPGDAFLVALTDNPLRLTDSAWQQRSICVVLLELYLAPAANTPDNGREHDEPA